MAELNAQAILDARGASHLVRARLNRFEEVATAAFWLEDIAPDRAEGHVTSMERELVSVERELAGLREAMARIRETKAVAA